MEFVMTILEGAWRYVTTIRIADYLDIALMAYCCYLLLRLVRSTRAESLVKGIMVFLLALWISHVFKLNGIYFILNHMLDVGILALIVLFQAAFRSFACVVVPCFRLGRYNAGICPPAFIAETGR